MTGAFVGRDTELSALDAAFDRALRGAVSVVIEGEPGIGKTTLARAFCDALGPRARVAWGRAFDGGGAPPWWPVVSVLRALCDTGDDRADRALLGPELATLASLVPELAARFERIPAELPLDPSRALAAIHRSVTAVLRRASRAAPLVVALDDLHAADAPTLALARFALRALTDAPVLLLGNARTVDTRAPPDTLAALAALIRESSVISLGGLDRDAVASLVARSGNVDPALTDAVMEASRGNPLFVEGMLRERGPTPRLPRPLRAVVLERLRRLPDATLAALRALALYGRPAPATLLAAITASPLRELVESLDLARRDALVTQVSTRELDLAHPVFGECLRDAMGPLERASLHARIGHVVDDLYGADPARAGEVARHLLAASSVEPTLDRGVARALDAAEHARRGATHHDAASLLALAVDCVEAAPSHDPRALTELRLRSSRASLFAGHRGEAMRAASRAADEAERRGDASALCDAALAYARAVEYGVLDPEKFSLLERAVSASSTAPSALACRARAALATELWSDPDAEPRRDALSAEALAMARALGDEALLAAALAARIQATWSPDAVDQRRALTEELVALVSRSPDPAAKLEAHRFRLNLAVELGDTATARVECDRYARAALALRDPQLRYNALLRRGLFSTMTGDLDAALRLADEALAAAESCGDPQAAVIRASQGVLFAVERDDREALTREVRALEPEVVRRPNFPLYGAILLRGYLALGERESASRAWARLTAGRFTDLPAYFGSVATLALLAESCRDLDDVRLARRLAERLRPFEGLHACIGATFSFGSTARYLGLCLAVAGDLDGARAALTRAIEHNARIEAPFWEDRCRRDLDALAPRPAQREHRRCVLAREGAVWRVADGDRAARVKDQVGLRLLAALLARPGVAVHALTLATDGRAESEGLRGGGAGPTLDAKARERYRARVEALRDEAEEAESFGDRARAERAREALETIAEELSRAVGLGGRDRSSSDAGERARVRVTKAVARAVAAVRAELPALGEHLARAVKTGSSCVYDPEPGSAPEWYVSG